MFGDSGLSLSLTAADSDSHHHHSRSTVGKHDVTGLKLHIKTLSGAYILGFF